MTTIKVNDSSKKSHKLLWPPGEQPDITRWWWIRHAPVIGGEGRLYGQEDLDCDVSETPLYEALARHLPEGAQWIVTNLSRTTKTASAIRDAGITGFDLVQEPELAEQYFGQWQGLTWAEMQSRDKAAYHDFWQDPTGNAPPGGESFDEVIERCVPAIDRLVESHGGRDIICVAHAGSIRAAIAHALGIVPERALAISIDNLSLTRLDHIAGGTLNGAGKSWRIGGINLAIR